MYWRPWPRRGGDTSTGRASPIRRTPLKRRRTFLYADRTDGSVKLETIMAKGQKHGNREFKKPKAVKAAVAASPSASVTKSALAPIAYPKNKR
jgi:hypothetical protein